MLFAFLMQAAATCPNAFPPAKKEPPKPLLAYTDYPPEALSMGWEGDVVAELTISPAGKVSSCKIVRSSGHAVLDDATCKIMIDRARFVPAYDQHCNPIESQFQTPPIHWRIR